MFLHTVTKAQTLYGIEDNDCLLCSLKIPADDSALVVVRQHNKELKVKTKKEMLPGEVVVGVVEKLVRNIE